MNAIKVPAIKVEQPLGTFYAFALNARALLNVTYSQTAEVIEATSKDTSLKSYAFFGTQRRENPRRLDEISQFIQSSDATFPNAIILAANYDERGVLVDDDTMRWRVSEENGCLSLTIPENATRASIIDGQHRLHAFNELSASVENADMQLLCAVFLELPTPYHAFVFATINFNQVKVPRSLAYQLFGFDVEQKPSKFWVPETAAVSIARLLGASKESPFEGCIITGLRSSRKEDISVDALTQISLATVVDGILRLISKNPKEDREAMRKAGNTEKTREILTEESGLPLRRFYLEDNDRAVYEVIRNYFTAISNVIWKNAENGSYLRKTVGVQAQFDVLKEMLTRIPLTKAHLSEEAFTTALSACKGLNALNPDYQASGIGRTRIRTDMLRLIYP